MMTHDQLAALMAIAVLAVEADDRQAVVKHQKIALHHAYNKWKGEAGIEHVERGTPEWDAMLTATRGEYERMEKAKQAERNVRRRLANAVRKYRDVGRAA